MNNKFEMARLTVPEICRFAIVALVPKLLFGNPDSEALASRDKKLELPTPNSQAGAWELAKIKKPA